MAKYLPGKYLCEITSQRFGKTEKGDPFFRIVFNPLSQILGDGEEIPLDSIYERNTRFMLTTEKSVAFCVSVVEAIMEEEGCVASAGDLDPENPNGIKLAGRQFVFECKPGQNPKYEDWNPVLAKKGDSGLDSRDQIKLNHLFGKATGKRASVQTRPANVPSKMSEEIDGDDSPF